MPITSRRAPRLCTIIRCLVRSHDFAGETVSGMKTLWQAPQLLGQGSPAGGGAHFVGSLADLPYVLAELEQDFISPENVQALIWKELTPESVDQCDLAALVGCQPDGASRGRAVSAEPEKNS